MGFGADEHKQAKQMLKSEDFNETWQIQGKLPYPLGTVITIEGVVADSSKLGIFYRNSTVLQIEKVQDKSLEKPVLLRVSRQSMLAESEKSKVNDRFRYLGFETAEFSGVPRESLEKAGVATGLDFGIRHLFLIFERPPNPKR